MSEKRMIIGLTGGAGSGKSTAAKFFQKLGARVINADRIGHDLLKKGLPCRDKVIKAFGPSIVTGGRINRMLLGKIVFGNKRELEKLNRIVQPHILKEINNKISTIKNNGFKGLVIVDAALIVSWGLQKKLDLLIVVDVPVKTRLDRLTAKGISLSQARRIMASQLPVSKLKREAGIIVTNDGSLSGLKKKARMIHHYLAAQIRRRKLQLDFTGRLV
ncbi:MAG: dephospho-CoA kinase [bacterium]|nr:dephospho-CoA kinase [bacterium]